MKKGRNTDGFIKKPEYPGGKEALSKFIRDNLKYPEQAREAGVEGTVYLTFKVEYDGSVQDIKVLSGIGHGCDEEAVRLAGLLKFSAQKNRGSRVSTQRKLNIHFKLPERKPETGRKITYSYKESSGNTTSISYTYTWTDD